MRAEKRKNRNTSREQQTESTNREESPYIAAYFLLKGDRLDDHERLALKAAVKKEIKRFGLKYLRDADAGLLEEYASSGEWVAREEEIRIYNPYRGDYPSRIEGNRRGTDFLNVFLDGRVKDHDKINIRDLEDELTDFIQHQETIYRRYLKFSLFFLKSPLHRVMHHDHDCIPSVVLWSYPNKVVVESCLMDEELYSMKYYPERRHGLLATIRDTPPPPAGPTPPKRVPINDWFREDYVQRIPDGRYHGVGGKDLLLSFSLERSGFHGGDLPAFIKPLRPEDVGLEEVKDTKSLPVLAMNGAVKIVSASAGQGERGLTVSLVLLNTTSHELVVEIPHGGIFEVDDPKEAVQNIVAAEPVTLHMNPNEQRSIDISGFCANRRFSTPNGQNVRPTIFKMRVPGNSQSEVWNTLDSMGFN